MAVDEYAQPKSLIATEEQLTQVQVQNKYGLQRETITEIPQGQYLTVLPVFTVEPMSPETYFNLLSELKRNYGVTAVQSAFAGVVPQEDGYQCDLHMTAHMRLEQKPEPIQEPGPALDPEPTEE